VPVLTQGAALRSRQPTVLVENRLEAGSWRFRLTVVDDAGVESSPAELIVRVVQRTVPPGPVVRPDPIVVRPQPVVEPAPPAPLRPARPPS
jgi:hypothetical protein